MRLYQIRAEPPPAANLSTLTPLSWLAKHVDAVPRKTSPATQTTTQPFSATPLVPREWAPTFPDRVAIAASALVVDQKPAGFVVLAPTLTWSPQLVDLAPARQARPQSDASQPFTATLSTLTPLAWAPKFDSLVAGRPGVATTTHGARVDAPFELARGWGAMFADRHAYRQPAEHQAFATGMTFAASAEQYGWRPSYPDRHVYLRAPEFVAFATGATSSTFPVAALAWAPEFADFATAPRRAAEYQPFALHPVPLTITVDQMAWRGVSADWIVRRLPVEYPAFVTGSTTSSLPVASLSWQPVFVDVAAGPRRVADLPAYAFWPQPLAGTPALSWQGVWPDRLWRNGTTQPDPTAAPVAQATIPLLTGWLPSQDGPNSLRRWPLWTDLVVPASQTTVPLLVTWRAAYPDRLAARIVVDGHRADRVTFTAVVPTYFSAEYPDLLLPVVRVNGGLVEIPDWEVLRPASPTRAWAGAYPDFARGPRPLPLGAMPALGIPGNIAPIILFGPISARFVRTSTGQPMWSLETWGQPTLTQTGTGQPGFTNEEDK